jgi:SAM-dependent methyltransferase
MQATPGDHFSGVAAGYAKFRPRYPAALFDWLAQQPPRRTLALECAAGSGQATGELASRFARVVATDISAQQLGQAPALPNVDYRVAPAESSGLASGTTDLVAVAQALHWFAHDRFFDEVTRVLVPGGVFAAWSYNWLETGDRNIDEIIGRFVNDTVGAYWPPERAIVNAGYDTIPFPFAEIAAPQFEMTSDWALPHFVGYVRTWSAVSRYIAATGEDPVSPFALEILRAWGDPSRARRIAWPLTMRVGRVDFEVAMR